ncbi:hypothetical protein AVEN_218161-1 [Araneus ventricosus]|uniref:Uncharacterized protein n=1 Tax=Araneus ventricosus TaxID=182803 RepID=A0A4Y2FUA0_ARAVE|nr:hypothetical protein AVEN_218161-1 [Araneus ventricosus]
MLGKDIWTPKLSQSLNVLSKVANRLRPAFIAVMGKLLDRRDCLAPCERIKSVLCLFVYWKRAPYYRPLWPSCKVGTGGSQVRNPIPLKIRRVWDQLHAKSYVVANRRPVGVAWKLGEGVPAEVSS